MTAVRAFEKAAIEFIEKTGQGDPFLYLKLVEEEARELLDAQISLIANVTEDLGDEIVPFVENVIKEAIDYLYVLYGLTHLQQLAEAAGQPGIGEDGKLRVFGFNMALNSLLRRIENELGIDRMVEALNEVHRSNLSKFGEDGKPIFDDNGKVIKGPNYSPANLRSFAEQVAVESRRAD